MVIMLRHAPVSWCVAVAREITQLLYMDMFQRTKEAQMVVIKIPRRLRKH